MPTLLDLPDELILKIGAFLPTYPRSTILSFVRVHSRLYRGSIELLYSRISFDWKNYKSEDEHSVGPMAATFWRLSNSLASSPQLASLVRSLTLRLEVHVSFLQYGVWRLLPHVPSLAELHISIEADGLELKRHSIGPSGMPSPSELGDFTLLGVAMPTYPLHSLLGQVKNVAEKVLCELLPPRMRKMQIRYDPEWAIIEGSEERACERLEPRAPRTITIEYDCQCQPAQMVLRKAVVTLRTGGVDDPIRAHDMKTFFAEMREGALQRDADRRLERAGEDGSTRDEELEWYTECF